MLIDITDIQKIRSVASNIDLEKVNNYIREAERLDLIPVITYDLYKRLERGDEAVIEVEVDKYGIAVLLADEDDTLITVEATKTSAEELMLDGGEYYDRCGNVKYIEGVKVALAYFAYARMVRNHQVAVTPFGVVSKMGDDSNPTDARMLASVAADAVNIATAMLRRCAEFWLQVEECRGLHIMRKSLAGNGKKKFIAIGD